MIKAENTVINASTDDEDFTVSHYRQLLKMARRNYDLTSYNDIPWGTRFVLWRHDMDVSLNRGLSLAHIESQEGVKSTYFINPHSEFYNIAEAAQHQIIQEILSLGHDLGLHFGAGFYGIESEGELDRMISREANYLYELFGFKPLAFSFHDPVANHLLCEADYYGGLVNCYSKRFKEEVPYCSDSNGYWRFRRLYDVLKKGNDSCLQVLTHPGWWQHKPMPPRKRIFRSAFGRATATIRGYDDSMIGNGRVNHAGTATEALAILKNTQLKSYELCDYLWNNEHYQTLFIELWCLHESQIKRWCKVVFRNEWQVSEVELNTFFGEGGHQVGVRELFEVAFDITFKEALSVDQNDYNKIVIKYNHIVKGQSLSFADQLEECCLRLCYLLKNFAKWGLSQGISYDGLNDDFNETVVKIQEKHNKKIKDDNSCLSNKRWEALKSRLGVS